MAKLIQIKCNGPDEHINEVDLEKAFWQVIVIKEKKSNIPKTLPERVVLQCKYCKEGRLVITKLMLDEYNL